METTVEVTGLRKRFGPTIALDGMTFTVSPGQVTGFVGPNGAGKANIGLRHFFARLPGAPPVPR
jgi:ABC-type branched-subunit amino acid transport system ATPase component